MKGTREPPLDHPDFTTALTGIYSMRSAYSLSNALDPLLINHIPEPLIFFLLPTSFLCIRLDRRAKLWKVIFMRSGYRLPERFACFPRGLYVKTAEIKIFLPSF